MHLTEISTAEDKQIIYDNSKASRKKIIKQKDRARVK